MMDPGLYPGDVMVATGERFPTVFYRLLAAVLPGPEQIPPAFFVLYLVAVAATLAGAYRIGRWAGGPAAGALALAFAFPVRIGLAGESLYRVAFSHSHLASALTIWAMVWFLEGRRMLPLLVLSLGAYNHLLYSAYVLVPMVMAVLWEAREVGRRETWKRLAAAVVPLVPLAVWTLAHRSPMTPEWLELLRLRSSHHSFPSAFGADLPPAAALLALSVLLLSRMSGDRRRVVAVFLVGTALQFVLGTLFTEYWPLKAALQYQPHRAWRFLMLLLQGVVAAGVVAGWREGGLARVTAGATAIVAFTPGLEPLLPLVVLLQAVAGRPTPEPWARALAVCVLVGVTGWADQDVIWTYPGDMLPRALNETVIGAAALAVLLAMGKSSPPARPAAAMAAALLAVLWLTPRAFAGQRPRWESGAWRAVQDWARTHTPRAAVLLTPPKEAGFRVFSERTIVGEWKDGTQQYFDDAFVKEWGARMQVLGDDYEKLPEERLLELARRFGATYIVLPRQPARRGLVAVYRNPSWAVYRAEPARPAP